MLSKNIRRFVASIEDIGIFAVDRKKPILGLKRYFKINNSEMGRMIFHETVKDYLETYRTVWVCKIKAGQLSAPMGAVLCAIRWHYCLFLRCTGVPEAIGAKTRKHDPKSAEKQGYYFREFEWNNFLMRFSILIPQKRCDRLGKCMAGIPNQLSRGIILKKISIT